MFKQLAATADPNKLHAVIEQLAVNENPYNSLDNKVLRSVQVTVDLSMGSLGGRVRRSHDKNVVVSACGLLHYESGAGQGCRGAELLWLDVCHRRCRCAFSRALLGIFSRPGVN